VGDFRGIPCLFTPAEGAKKRVTQGTVEAISLDHGTNWIGINQNRINGWVEQLLRENALRPMIDSDGCKIRHEVNVEDSRIDLVIETEGKCTFLELKTPTHDLLLSPGDNFTRPQSPNYFDRGLRHFRTLARLAQAGHRTIVALCFMYNAQTFSPPERMDWNAKIIDTIVDACASGVENWQINLKITPNLLEVVRCTKSDYSAR
jgi:DNA-binding sugar fermentation-stimulating protein